MLKSLSPVRLCDSMDCGLPGQSTLSMGFPRQKARVGCHFLLQGIFPTQGSNSCLLHRQVGSLPPESPYVHIRKSLSRVRLSATPWTAACQAPLSMGFSRQEYWSGLPFPSAEDLPNPGIERRSPAL